MLYVQDNYPLKKMPESGIVVWGSLYAHARCPTTKYLPGLLNPSYHLAYKKSDHTSGGADE